MNLETAAKCLAELGSPTRLAVYRLLVKAGRRGLTVGEIQEHLQIPKSTLSHHLAHLGWAGLVVQERESRSLRCAVVYETMDALMTYLAKECCTGVKRAPRKAQGAK